MYAERIGSHYDPSSRTDDKEGGSVEMMSHQMRNMTYQQSSSEQLPHSYQ